MKSLVVSFFLVGVFAVAQDGVFAFNECEELSLKQKDLDGKKYTFSKCLDKNNNIFEIVRDHKGNIIKNFNGKSKNNPIYQDVKSLLSNNIKDDTLKVLISLKVDPSEELTSAPSSGEAIIENGSTVSLKINNQFANKKDVDLEILKYDNFEKFTKQLRKTKIEESIEVFAKRNNLEHSADIKKALLTNNSSIELNLRVDNIKDFVDKNIDIISGIEEIKEPAPLISDAMISTKINPFALNDSGHRGSNIGVFVKEALGCPYNGYMQNYTHLSGTPHYHDMIVTSIIRAVSPNSHIYCRYRGNMLPTQNELLGLNGNPRIYIENYSLYYTHHISPYYTDIDKQFDNHAYYNDTVIFVANGNRFTTDVNNNVIKITPYTLTPAKALNVISVGNYDNSNDTISHSSNYINSQIKNEKPEIVAPGTNIDIAGYINNNGTSYASPHAAGLAADMMSKYEWMRLKPYYFKAMMMAGSTKNVGGGTDKVGVGGIDFHRTAYYSRNNWWQGSNSSFSYYDSVDPYPNNGYIDWKVMLYANKPTRAVIAWFNRGDYIYEHRNDAHPIGMDFDLQILDTNNKIIGHSASWDNPYEIVDFIPATTGEYIIRIKRYANRDLNSMIKLGASVNIDY